MIKLIIYDINYFKYYLRIMFNITELCHFLPKGLRLLVRSSKHYCFDFIRSRVLLCILICLSIDYFPWSTLTANTVFVWTGIKNVRLCFMRKILLPLLLNWQHLSETTKINIKIIFTNCTLFHLLVFGHTFPKKFSAKPYYT